MQSACKVAGVGKGRSQVLGNSILSTAELLHGSLGGFHLLQNPFAGIRVPAPTPSPEVRGRRGWR